MEEIENQFSDRIKIVDARIIVTIVALAMLMLLALVFLWISSMPRQETIIGSVILLGIGLTGAITFGKIYSAENRNQKKNEP